MLLKEVLSPIDAETQVAPPAGDFTVSVGATYIFSPVAVRDKDEELHHLLTVYSPDEDDIKTYSIVGTDPVVFQVIRSDFPVEDTRIVRVQILSDVDTTVDKYDATKEKIVTDDDNEAVTLKLKQLPDFENLDMISDESFEEKYKRRRKPYEHGLVGYLYLDEEPVPSDEFNRTNVGASRNVASSYDTDISNNTTSNVFSDQHSLARSERSGKGGGVAGHKFNNKSDFRPKHSSKMQRAIALYKSNQDMPRTHVIKLIMRHLDMTRAGASSYYTKAMHAVEEEIKDNY